MAAINLDQIQFFSKEQFEEHLAKNEVLEIDYTCSMVNFAQEPLDVASDYLTALYVGERLVRVCEKVEADELDSGGGYPSRFVRFTLTPDEIGATYLELVRLSHYVSEEDEDAENRFEFAELLDEYRDQIAERPREAILFPDLLEIYEQYVDMHGDDEE